MSLENVVGHAWMRAMPWQCFLEQMIDRGFLLKQLQQPSRVLRRKKTATSTPANVVDAVVMPPLSEEAEITANSTVCNSNGNVSRNFLQNISGGLSRLASMSKLPDICQPSVSSRTGTPHSSLFAIASMPRCRSSITPSTSGLSCSGRDHILDGR